jgi:uncharacterized protein (DUF2147 family)
MNAVRLCLALTAFLLTTSPGLADEVLGTWLRDTGDEKVKFEPCGDAICGDIVWLKPGSGLNAKIGKSIQAKCLLKDPPSSSRAASSVD